MHPQRQAPAASLAGRLGQFKLSVGQYPIENHHLGIALPELYLKEPPYYTRVFFFLFNTSRLSNSTSSPANTVVTVREQLDDAMLIDGAEPTLDATISETKFRATTGHNFKT